MPDPSSSPSPADPWHDLRIEAGAQFSALCMQIGQGRYPWEEEQKMQADASALASSGSEQPSATQKQAEPLGLLIV